MPGPKSSFLILLLLSILHIACDSKAKYADRENAESDYYVIPKPSEVTPQNGAFHLNNDIAMAENDQFSNEINLLSGYLKKDFESEISTGEDGLIQFSIKDSISNKEGYELVVTPETIRISGGSEQGIFYGLQTLRQLIVKTNDGDLIIPSVKIKDVPAFGYRGMHLDVARHFYGVDDVKTYLDMLALHKINTFHWHLTEDQGWRIEIKQYPELTNTGAYRNGTIIGHYPGEGNDNERYGGFYTQEEVKEVVQYAAERHITVIPEIEMPGHSQAAIASYPFLSCFPEEKTIVPNDLMSEAGKELQANGTPKIVQESWGVYNDVYCAGKDSTFTFLENVLDEVIPLFPSEYIHIGGDECPKKNWERCPECQQRMKNENLKDEHELQSYFVQRMEKYINSKGKKIIGWDEILEGGLAPNATVMSWRGESGGIEAAKQNHDVIMSPNSYCYFDHYQAEDTENEPLAIGGFLPVEKVYSYNPIPSELPEDQTDFILGPQANVWTEYIKTFDNIQYMTLPRMAAIAETGWSKTSEKEWDDFENRLGKLRKIYDGQNYNYATHVFDQPKQEEKN